MYIHNYVLCLRASLVLSSCCQPSDLGLVAGSVLWLQSVALLVLAFAIVDAAELVLLKRRSHLAD